MLVHADGLYHRRRQLCSRPVERITGGVAFTGPGIPRQGNPVRTPHGDGEVTSGSLSPCLGVGIGMAYLPLAATEPGTPIEVDVRGKLRQAEVRRKPLFGGGGH